MGARVIPTLTTERLTLTAPAMRHWPAFRDFYASERARLVGGPLDPGLAWFVFTGDLGHWHLHGFGFWAVEMDGEPVGHVGLWHPPHHAEREVGWSVWEGFEGRGVAHEAALAARDWARASLPAAPLVSYIAEGNTASERLARRLGARADGPAEHAEAVTVWRHPS